MRDTCTTTVPPAPPITVQSNSIGSTYVKFTPELVIWISVVKESERLTGHQKITGLTLVCGLEIIFPRYEVNERPRIINDDNDGNSDNKDDGDDGGITNMTFKTWLRHDYDNSDDDSDGNKTLWRGGESSINYWIMIRIKYRRKVALYLGARPVWFSTRSHRMISATLTRLQTLFRTSRTWT